MKFHRPNPHWRPSTPEVTDHSLDDLLEQLPAIAIHFWATWNGVDPPMGRNIGKIADTFAGRIRFYSCDVDTTPGSELGVRFGIVSVPTLAVFRRGQKPCLIIGFREPWKLAERLDEILSKKCVHPWWAFWRR
ncbi:MAG: thioredoxin domain-containing protein [Pirellulales bacterium]